MSLCISNVHSSLFISLVVQVETGSNSEAENKCVDIFPIKLSECFICHMVYFSTCVHGSSLLEMHWENIFITCILPQLCFEVGMKMMDSFLCLKNQMTKLLYGKLLFLSFSIVFFFCLLLLLQTSMTCSIFVFPVVFLVGKLSVLCLSYFLVPLSENSTYMTLQLYSDASLCACPSRHLYC